MNVIDFVSEVHPKYCNLKYPLTRHMEHWRHRFGWTERFHANSEHSRLEYIANYIWDTVAHYELELYLSDNCLVSDLNESLTAFGPLTVFWHEIWRTRFRDVFDIYSEPGYYGFITHLLIVEAKARNLPSILFTDSLIAQLQSVQPGFHDPVLSRPMYAIWQSSELYRSIYSDLGDAGTRDAFALDILLHLTAGQKIDLLLSPEIERYWSRSHNPFLPQISRFVMLLASLSERFEAPLVAGTLDAGLSQAIADWWVEEVEPAMPTLRRLAPGLTPQIMSFDQAPSRRIGVSQTIKNYPLPGSVDEDIDVLVIGPIGAASGLGSGARRTIGALREAGVNFRLLPSNYQTPGTSQPGLMGPMEYRGERPKAVIWHYNAEYLPDVMTSMADFAVAGRQIAYFFWETITMPEALRLGCNIVDEIWVPSEFCRECFLASDAAVINVGSSIELPSVAPFITREEFGIKETTFVVMFSFDSHSVIHRKNPAAVVRAFQRAFDSEEDVILILKTQNLATAHWGEVYGRGEELLELCSADPRIRFFDKTMSAKELYSLKALCNAYISLHRSEGYGYGPAEAMALGKPVIMTNYSANIEFATDDNCLLVDGPLVPTQMPEYLYTVSGMEWADPDVDDAARKLRLLYDDPELARQIGDRARQTINEAHGVEAMARRVRGRLAELGIVSGDGR